MDCTLSLNVAASWHESTTQLQLKTCFKPLLEHAENKCHLGWRTLVLNCNKYNYDWVQRIRTPYYEQWVLHSDTETLKFVSKRKEEFHASKKYFILTPKLWPSHYCSFASQILSWTKCPYMSFTLHTHVTKAAIKQEGPYKQVEEPSNLFTRVSMSHTLCLVNTIVNIYIALNIFKKFHDTTCVLVSLRLLYKSVPLSK